MRTKEEYLAEAKAHLNEWEAELKELGRKAGHASDDVKEKVEEQMAELKAKWDEGAAHRQEILDAADDKWDDLKEEAEQKWMAVKAGARERIDRIKALFG